VLTLQELISSVKASLVPKKRKCPFDVGKMYLEQEVNIRNERLGHFGKYLQNCSGEPYEHGLKA
jgi:hypothetical protein